MKSRGFILVATLWILAGITIAATYFAQRIAASIELAKQYDAHIQTQIACSDSKAEIAYLLATQGFSMYGLGDPATHIKLNNKPYRMEGDCIARFQDTRGLYAINGASRDTLGVLLSRKGVPEAEHDRLFDTLMDYMDPTPNMHRLNGVQKEDYKTHGLPAPTGQLLVTPDQLRQVYGWKEQDSLWSGSEPITDWVTTARVIAVNPNTAIPAVLMTLPGITAEAVPKILQYRNIEPILNEGQLANLLGIDVQQLYFKVIAFPADTIRVSLGSDSQQTSIRYNVALTPIAPEAPWRIDYYYRIPQRIIQKNNDAIPSIPFDLTATPASAATAPFILEGAPQ